MVKLSTGAFLFKKIILTQFLLLTVFICCGQVHLCIGENEKDKGSCITLNSEEVAKQKVEDQLFNYQQDGYLTAGYSFEKIGDSIFVIFEKGELWKWAEIRKGNVPEEILSKAGFRDKIYNNKALQPKHLSEIAKRIIRECENNGYPFAAMRFDSIEVLDNRIKASLNLHRGNFVKIDSIKVIGSDAINETYLQNYLGIKPSAPYNESLISKISVKIDEIPFARENKESEVLFTEEYTKLYLFLEDVKANDINGIIGFLPNDEIPGTFIITGDVRLILQNSFKKGERIDLNWRRLQSNTQDLQLKANYPFILNSSFGAEVDFKFYRRDTTFSDVISNIGLQYFLSGGNSIRIFARNQSSNLISTHGLEFVNVLPDYADITKLYYGIGLNHRKLDYLYNPRKGHMFNANVAAGNRSIRQNPAISELAYENIDLRTVQYYGEIKAALFIPIRSRMTVKLGTNSGALLGDNIFANELYRIGGIQTLRGFDEESIFAENYSINTVEFRYLLEKNSFAYLFGDFAFYDLREDGKYISDTPLGFGAGLSFETQAGIFSINYAVGQQMGNPILFRAAKIHFGFINYF